MRDLTQRLQSFSSFRQSGGLLLRYLRPQRGAVAGMAVLLLASIGLQLVSPQVIRYFLDSAQTGGTARMLMNAALIYILFALLQQAAAVAATYTSQNVGWAATNRLRTDLALHCLRLDLPFHKRHTPGELIERLDGDVTRLANFFSAFSVRLVGNGLLVIGILVLLLRENGWFALGMALYTLAALAVMGAIQRVALPRWLAERQASAQMYGYLEERISGAEDIRAAGAEHYALGRLYSLMRDFMQKQRAAFVFSTLAFTSTNLVYAFGYAAGLALGVYLYTRGEASLGTAYLIVAYVGMLADPLQGIREQIEDLQKSTASIKRIQALFDLRPKVGEVERAVNLPGQAPAGGRIPSGALALAFERVSFRYNDLDGADTLPPIEEDDEAEELPASHPLPGASDLAPDEQSTELTAPRSPLPLAADLPGAVNRPLQIPTEDEPVSPRTGDGGELKLPTDQPAPDGAALTGLVLDEVSFDLPAGRVLGILGRTGSGKSTLTRLLFRLYDPDSGTVRLDGADLRQMPLSDLRSRVGMVTQDVQLFNATLRDNLTFFNPRISDDRLVEAIKTLRLWDWVESLPDGLDTVLAAGGAGLSAGEGQLLAFTRVFLKDPGLVVLDEASSRLDPATEMLLERAVDRLFAGRTGVVIAHRLKTVERADDILILEGGRVVEYGPRAALARDPNTRFYSLLQTGLEEALV